MSKVVVISGHPDLEQSYTNTVILQQLEASKLDVEVRRLDSLYPDYHIDVAAEQRALMAADVIVLQFPLYWYSTPALLKKWLDDVFAYNFAYGAEGDKLKGKDFFLSLTVGGPEESYDPLGYNHFTVEQMLHPLQQTAYLAGMNYRAPIYTNRMVFIPGVYNTQADVEERARDHATRLMSAIRKVVESPEAIIKKFVAAWFAEFDQLPAESEFFTQSLASDVQWVTPEGEFAGHEGFRDWYNIAKATFKPGCDHHVEQITVNPKGAGFEVQLRIRLIAETQSASEFKGAPVNMLVNETWQVQIEAGRVEIQTYHVEPVTAS
ncbi:NAD(P)H-dependent oxidoreductase [Neptunomonas sp. XY-337]|uniref:NAD(P)H-dependent oxidoreductase n=1 Tax=Neptunomonas sp. XY-337 TaxID=2561897 RepID=UPI0010A9A245|nr:NAD(P)H-dependent oxidoreductase [Neptunomonas sp. XY-337]